MKYKVNEYLLDATFQHEIDFDNMTITWHDGEIHNIHIEKDYISYINPITGKGGYFENMFNQIIEAYKKWLFNTEIKKILEE